MTNAEEIYIEFWKDFEKLLKEKNHPFKIIHGRRDGSETSWANINKKHSRNNNAIDLSLQTRKKLFRIDFYVTNENSNVGQILLNNKENINNEISVPIIWENGTKNKNTLRVSYYISYDGKSFKEVIESALPIIDEFIKVANKYGEDYFFDF